MDIFILTFAVLGCVIVAMSVGVLLGRQPIKGSCGGMGAMGVETACDICGGNPAKCDEEQQKTADRAQTPAALAYEVKA
jgi:hypothetical protein